MDNILYPWVFGGIVWLCIWCIGIPYIVVLLNGCNKIWFTRFWGNFIGWAAACIGLVAAFPNVVSIIFPFLVDVTNSTSTYVSTHTGHIIVIALVSPFIPIVNNLFVPAAIIWITTSVFYWRMLLL